MKILISIRTPKDRAKKINNSLWFRSLRKAMMRNVKYTTHCNDANDTMVWEVEGYTKHVMKLTQNVHAGDIIMRHILENKQTLKLAKGYDEQGKKDLEFVTKHPMEVEVIKGPGEEEEKKSSLFDKLKFWEKI